MTIEERISNNGKRIRKVVIDWTSDSGGEYAEEISGLYGYVLKLVTIPSDSAAPTDKYDVSLLDENGVDALADAGADRSTNTVEQAYPAVSGATIPACLCGGTHTFKVENAGDTKSGTAILYLAEEL